MDAIHISINYKVDVTNAKFANTRAAVVCRHRWQVRDLLSALQSVSKYKLRLFSVFAQHRLFTCDTGTW